MKPDSMLVEPEHINSARREVAGKAGFERLKELAQFEPALASFIYDSLTHVAGKLALSGAATELVQGSHQDTLNVILTCVQALRHGHYALWRDTMTDTRLAQLDPSIEPKREVEETPSAPQQA